MINIYGSPKSSSGRCFWALEEVGVPYKATPIDFKSKEHKSDAFLEINPNGKVPAMVDGNFKIWESMAINTYLAEKYKPELLGSTPESRALCTQWNLWSLAELQTPLIDIFIQKEFVPGPHRDLKLIEKRLEKLPSILKVLEDELNGKDYLLGDNFTIADLNAHSVVQICNFIKFDLAEYKNINEWMTKISERDAYKKYQTLLN